MEEAEEENPVILPFEPFISLTSSYDLTRENLFFSRIFTKLGKQKF
jgi:hypothetical protein